MLLLHEVLPTPPNEPGRVDFNNKNSLNSDIPLVTRVFEMSNLGVNAGQLNEKSLKFVIGVNELDGFDKLSNVMLTIAFVVQPNKMSSRCFDNVKGVMKRSVVRCVSHFQKCFCVHFSLLHACGVS